MSAEEALSPSDETSKATPEREETMETAEVESVSTEGKNMPQLSDEESLNRAKEHMRKDQVLAASRLLKLMGKIPEEEATFQKEVEGKTALLQGVNADLLADPDVGDGGEDANQSGTSTWIKMGESHDEHRDTVSYYKLSEDLQLTFRIETPLESSLLVPLLSVLIETDLFTTWLPRWTVPRIGLATVNKLAQMGRTEQIVHFITEVPWPFTARDVVLQTCACDDIDDIEGPTTGTIAIGLHSLEGGDEVRRSVVCNQHYMDAPEVLTIQPEDEGLKRAEFEGGLLIRKCPDDHVTLQNSTINYPSDEHLILVGFSCRLDGKISPIFPTTIINFVIQTAIVQMWAMFLKVAEEIRDGSRPQHADAIAAKREEIYDWVDQRIEAMFANLQKIDTKSDKGEDVEEKKE